MNYNRCYYFKEYSNKCPLCGSDLFLDDLDYNFQGCQDEYIACTNKDCTFDLICKVRFNKIFSIK